MKDKGSSIFRSLNFHAPLDVQYAPKVGHQKGSLNALSDPQGPNLWTLSTLKQGAVRVDRLPQELPGVGIEKPCPTCWGGVRQGGSYPAAV